MQNLISNLSRAILLDTKLLLVLLLFPCVADAANRHHRWQLGVSDPSILSWLVVILYLFVAIISYQCIKLSRKVNKPIIFWVIITLMLIFLGLNKQLDFQTLITQIGRDIAKSHNLYQGRRQLQVQFVIGLISIFTISLVYLNYKLKGLWAEYRLVLLGIIVLFSYVFVRAASFYHMGSLIGVNMLGKHVIAGIEVLAIMLIGIGTLFWIKRTKTSKD